MNKHLSFLLITSVIAVACNKPKQPDANEVRAEVEKTERSFSSYSAEHGFAKALAQYAAPDVVKLTPGQYAAFGKNELEALANADSIGNKNGTLTWEPRKTDVSSSGDMALVFGDWYFNYRSRRSGNDTTLFGNYITIWKRQPDGNWRFLSDAGNDTPGPTTDEMLKRVR